MIDNLRRLSILLSIFSRVQDLGFVSQTFILICLHLETAILLEQLSNFACLFNQIHVCAGIRKNGIQPTKFFALLHFFLLLSLEFSLSFLQVTKSLFQLNLMSHPGGLFLLIEQFQSFLVLNL